MRLEEFGVIYVYNTFIVVCVIQGCSSCGVAHRPPPYRLIQYGKLYFSGPEIWVPWKINSQNFANQQKVTLVQLFLL